MANKPKGKYTNKELIEFLRVENEYLQRLVDELRQYKTQCTDLQIALDKYTKLAGATGSFEVSKELAAYLQISAKLKHYNVLKAIVQSFESQAHAASIICNHG